MQTRMTAYGEVVETLDICFEINVPANVRSENITPRTTFIECIRCNKIYLVCCNSLYASVRFCKQCVKLPCKYCRQDVGLDWFSIQTMQCIKCQEQKEECVLCGAKKRRIQHDTKLCKYCSMQRKYINLPHPKVEPTKHEGIRMFEEILSEHTNEFPEGTYLEIANKLKKAWAS